MVARLIALAGPVQGRTWTLGRELSIGRSNNNQVQIEDRALSRQQCTIREEDGRFRLEDQRSSNGTFINGQPVTGRVLKHGDEIRVGHSVFVFLEEGAAREAEDAFPEPVGVELDQGQTATATTLLLRAEDALYLAPDKAVIAMKRNERALGTSGSCLRSVLSFGRFGVWTNWRSNCWRRSAKRSRPTTQPYC